MPPKKSKIPTREVTKIVKKIMDENNITRTAVINRPDKDGKVNIPWANPLNSDFLTFESWQKSKKKREVSVTAHSEVPSAESTIATMPSAWEVDLGSSRRRVESTGGDESELLII